MSYVKVTDGAPVEIFLSQLRAENPNVSFPQNPPAIVLAEYDVYPLIIAERPDADVVEKGPINQVDGEWTQTWIGRDYTDDERRAQMIVTARQARLALNAQGLLAQVETAIQALPEPDRTTISLEWEYAGTIERLSPWIAVMGSGLGLSDSQLDDLFVLAATM